MTGVQTCALPILYPISENSFLDMGEFEEMKKMEERINSGYIH